MVVLDNWQPHKNPAVVSAIDLTIPGQAYRNPYTHQADIAIEHTIASDMNLSVSWLWNRALHLTTVRDLNIGPAGTPVGTTSPCPTMRGPGHDLPQHQGRGRVRCGGGCRSSRAPFAGGGAAGE